MAGPENIGAKYWNRFGMGCKTTEWFWCLDFVDFSFTVLAIPIYWGFQVLVAVSVCLATIVLNLHYRKPSTHKMPTWVRHHHHPHQYPHHRHDHPHRPHHRPHSQHQYSPDS